MSRFVKILLLVLLMVVACTAIAVMGFLSYQKEQAVFREAVIAEGKASVDQVADEIETRLDHYAGVVLELGREPSLAAWAEKRTEARGLKNRFNLLRAENAGLDRMIVVALDQRVFDTRPPVDFFEEIASARAADPAVLDQIQALLSEAPDTFYAESITASQGDWYNQMLAVGGLFFSAPYLNQDDQPAMAVSAPVMEGDTLVGVCALQILLREGVFPSAREFVIGTTGYCWVMDREGLLISHPRPENELTSSVRNHSTRALAQAVEEMIAGKGTEEAQWSEYSFEGVERLLFWRVIPETGWGVAVSVPAAEMMEAADAAGFATILKTLLLEAAVVFLFGLVIVFAAVRKPKK